MRRPARRQHLRGLNARKCVRFTLRLGALNACRPPTGVLEAPQGAFALPDNDIGLLAAVGPGSATITVQAPLGGPPTAAPTTSGNWSGYVARSTTNIGGFTATTTYTNIGGSWVVPSVQSSTGPTASSTWIGIDGSGNANLIQTGTEQDYSPGSGASYYAWWEILPAAETRLPTDSYPVKPGDSMSAEIHPSKPSAEPPNNEQSENNWDIVLKDNTAGWTFATTKTYNGPLTSAEWIQEATTVGGKVADLTKYSSMSFTGAFDNDPDGATSAGLTTSEQRIMVQKGVQVSTPSAPVCTADGFTVAYGATAPAVAPCPTPAPIAVVSPQLSLSAPTVTAGNDVTVTGTGFRAPGTVTLTLTLTGSGRAGEAALLEAPVTLGTATVSQGGFSTTITIPAGTAAGSYTIHAQSSGAQADVSIQVTAPDGGRTLTVTDGTGAVATSISTDTDYTLTGNNFAPGFGVTVYLDTFNLLDPSKSGPQLGTATAGLQSWAFTIPFEVDADQIGNTNGDHTFLVVSNGYVIARLTLPFIFLPGPR
jgi:Peptidase A4 family